MADSNGIGALVRSYLEIDSQFIFNRFISLIHSFIFDHHNKSIFKKTIRLLLHVGA